MIKFTVEMAYENQQPEWKKEKKKEKSVDDKFVTTNESIIHAYGEREIGAY